MTVYPIEVSNINKSFKKHHVLKDLTIKIEEGETYGLVGLNGIGKTTIIKIILGLLRQDSGDIHLFGTENSNIESKRKICYLPEKFTPSQFLKGYEFLELAAGYYQQTYDKKAALKICDELDFDPAALEKKVSSYSKGMGQKLGLVSVFLSKAPLLILDEPMSGLDPSARIFLKKKLQDYRKKGNSIFFSSHILADVEEICDRIGILHYGDLYYEGTVEKFIKKAKTKNLEQAFLSIIQDKAA
jgi:ABC-2 type transport system ATP-binding protein